MEGGRGTRQYIEDAPFVKAYEGVGARDPAHGRGPGRGAYCLHGWPAAAVFARRAHPSSGRGGFMDFRGVLLVAMVSGAALGGAATTSCSGPDPGFVSFSERSKAGDFMS